MTIILYWWMLPLALMLVAFVIFLIGSNESGFLGGVTHALISFGLFIGAIVALITGWIK